jgi:hypothetical protein
MLNDALLAFFSVPAPNGTESISWPCFVAAAVAFAFIGVAGPGTEERRVKAGRRHDGEGIARTFTLSLGEDTIALEWGKPWVHVDRYKWVMRGLIEEPQSFHVLRDGTVEINGEKIAVTDPEGPAKLELEINKHHPAVVSHKSTPAAPTSSAAIAETHGQGPGKVRFKVKIDPFGHLMIACFHGTEKVETGLRGLSGLIQNGLMLKPGNIHLDPLQRGIEIDGARFEASEAGARQLEETLNTRYAPILKVGHEGAIEIRENPASPTGFDIHFSAMLAGARFGVKGHLTQEQLEMLQNPARCNLLHHGIVLRLSPPHLLVRRKRPDGGEERLPDMPDINYLRSTARQLEEFFNHPSIHKTGSPPAPSSGAPAVHPLESRESGSPALTATTRVTTDAVGETAKPEVRRESSGAPAPTATTGIPQSNVVLPAAGAKASGLEAPVQRAVDTAILSLFSESDPLRVNVEIFQRLANRFGVPVQDLLLSLPRVFADRRFEIISFGEQEISSVLDLRGQEFYGFYLSHIGGHRIDFVYACRGTHIEWGADKCVLQPSADAEAMELKGGALLGFAQTSDNQFVFVVTPAYKQWIKPHEPRCREAFAHFRTVNDLAAEPERYTLVWPGRPEAREATKAG